MKTRLDQPHLEPLRYDYQLLHDTMEYQPPKPRYYTMVGFAFGFVAFVASMVGLMTVLFGG